MKLAVVDLGTNTCRLLLAEVERGTIVRMDVRETNVVRLGEGFDANRRLLPEAAARTRRRLDDYSRRIAAYHPDASLLLATSVLRDAQDGGAFLHEVSAATGLPARLIDGEIEARLAFRGATSRLDLPPSPVAVVDIGGGSTELSVAREPGQPYPAFVVSVDVGAVRIMERFFLDDPPQESQWQSAIAQVDGVLDKALPLELRSVGTLVGVAGTFTTLSAHLLGLREYDPWVVHGSHLTLGQIRSAIAHFRTLTNEQRGRLAGIQKGREDVILAGALLAERICLVFGAVEVTVSEADILDGAALWLADGLPPLT